MLALRGEYRGDAQAEAISRYRLHDVTAGSSGNEGGDS
jgi:pyruvate dehydrogenase E1 component